MGRQHQRPEYQRHHDTAYALAVESDGVGAGLEWQQQHCGHHYEQRHARPHEASDPHSGEKRCAVGVELGHESVAAVCEHHKECGYDAEHVDPAYLFTPLERQSGDVGI